MTVFRITEFVNGYGKQLAKTINYRDGKVIKDTDAKLNLGTYQTLHFATVSDLADYIIQNRGAHHKAISYGVNSQPSGIVAASWMFKTGKAPAGAIQRNNETFAFPVGAPGLHFQDLDGLHGDPAEIDRRLCQVFPWLAQVERIYVPSSGSHLYIGAEKVSPKDGYHLIYGISDASKAEALGKIMFQQLFAAGYGRAEVFADGDMEPRAWFDLRVWQGSRLDFAFGARLEDGLQQDLEGGLLRLPGACFLDVSGVGDVPDMAAWKAGSAEWKALHAEALPRALEIKARAKGLAVQELHTKRGVPLDRAQAIVDAAYDGEMRDLFGDFILYKNDWTPFTVDEAYVNPAEFHGLSFRPPLCPESGPSKAKMYLVGQTDFPAVNCYWKGEKKYRLVPSVTAVMGPPIGGPARPAGGVPLPPPLPVEWGLAPAPVAIPAALAAAEVLQPVPVLTQRQCELRADFPLKLRERMDQPVTPQQAGGVRYAITRHMLDAGRPASEIYELLLGTHLGAVPDLAREVGHLERSYHRRNEQRKVDSAIGNDLTQNPLTPIMTLQEMLADFIWLSVGKYVGRRSDGRVMRADDLAFELAASKTELPKKGSKSGELEPVSTFNMWRSSPDRVTVDAQTWSPAHPLICNTPTQPNMGGMRAMNTWRGLPPYQSQEDYMQRSQPFVDHMQYLCPVPAEFERQMEWIAHMIQRPGELPHTFYIHVATTHGIGRNWFAGILTRVLRGYVAANLDLEDLLDGKYNDELSRKLLAFSDEIQEGGGAAKFKRAKKLRQIVTAEYRNINPKCERKHTEYNYCRFLGFSNYEDAIALDTQDRRAEFIENPTEVLSDAYYSELYALRDDQRFIDAVRQRLENWDISNFNVGRRAEANAMKHRAIEAVSSPTELAVQQFAKDWPGLWVVTKYLKAELKAKLLELDGIEIDERDLDFALKRAGITNTSKTVRIVGGVSKVAVFSKRAQRARIESTDGDLLRDWDAAWRVWYHGDRMASPPMPT